MVGENHLDTTVFYYATLLLIASKSAFQAERKSASLLCRSKTRMLRKVYIHVKNEVGGSNPSAAAYCRLAQLVEREKITFQILSGVMGVWRNGRNAVGLKSTTE